MRRFLPSPKASPYLLAIAAAIVPLWVTHLLPLVDLPQHLHLISVMTRLSDASTLYPETFALRPALTSYLGYYYIVAALNLILPLDAANRIFLSAYIALVPLSVAFLLRSVKKPAWPALLTLPFAYGDSFAWGFINSCVAFPLALLACGLFIRALEDDGQRKKWAALLALTMVLVVLFHVQGFIYLGVALPFLLAMHGPSLARNWRVGVPALLGVVPSVILFIVWFALRLGQSAEIAPGVPWKSWGPLLSAENLEFIASSASLLKFISFPPGRLGLPEFPVLAGFLRSGGDQAATQLVIAITVVAFIVGWLRRSGRPTLGSLRIPGLFTLALLLYFATPFSVRGYMYYINLRYAHLAAPLLVACIPSLPDSTRKYGPWLGVLVAFVLSVPLARAFAAFDVESQPLLALAREAPAKAKTMGLIYTPGSRVVTHPVYLHAAAIVARERGGLANFSFALTPHSPVMYRNAPPPTFPSEWQPAAMSWEREGRAYNSFLLKGPRPSDVFGDLLGAEVDVVDTKGDATLLQRR